MIILPFMLSISGPARRATLRHRKIIGRDLQAMGLDPKVKDPQQDGLKPPPPSDPFNHAQVEEWQQRSQAPAAFNPPPNSNPGWMRIRTEMRPSALLDPSFARRTGG